MRQPGAARIPSVWRRSMSFYNEKGSLTVNGGAPSVGRTAITETARGFMTAFPDMVVKMDYVSQDGGHAIFRWTWTGRTLAQEALASPYESTATRNGRLVPMV